MATRTIEDILRESLAKVDGDTEGALRLVQSWSNADSSIRGVVEAFAWELVRGYLLDLRPPTPTND